MSALCEYVEDNGMLCIMPAYLGMYVGDGVSVAVCNEHYQED